MAFGLVLALVLVATVLGIAVYAKIARATGIVAVPNERTLHTKVTVRGGGVVVALVFSVALAIWYARGELTDASFYALFGGGVAVAALGFVDDIVHLSTRTRILVHLALAVWAVAWLGEPFGIGPLGIALAVIGMVWMINLYNFMDGIDGMAASGAVFFCATAGGLIAYLDSSPLWMLLFVLGAATLGFLCFNWPPARLFMGDSGSGFYGYIFGCLAILCAQTHALSLWTWIILLGYFLADTTTTTVIRAATVPRFWGTHRSHAYQNLARVWDNHRKMTLIVLAIDLGWLLPLALVSVAWHRAAFPLALVALAPIIGFAVIYGPRYDK